LSSRSLLLALSVAAMAWSCGEEAVVPTEVALSPAAQALVDTLYLDEYRAAERYDQVLRTFGAVAPFQELLPLQAQRLTALREVYAQYPDRAMPDPLAGLHYQERYADLGGACEVSAEFERRTAERYARALRLRLPPVVAATLSRNHQATVAIDLPRTSACR